MEEKTKLSSEEEIVHTMNQEKNTSFFSPVIIMLLTSALVLGVGTGYFLSRLGTTIPGVNTLGNNPVPKGEIVGSSDTKTFKDTAEGILEEGGIEGEGQYHLVRPGGISQNVYLTSSTVDLSQFVKKKIKVWGETHTAQTAGWLMDVGRVEALQ